MMCVHCGESTNYNHLMPAACAHEDGGWHCGHHREQCDDCEEWFCTLMQELTDVDGLRLCSVCHDQLLDEYPIDETPDGNKVYRSRYE